MKRTKTSLVLNRLLAGLGGFVIILLASVPLVFLGCLWVDGGGGGKFMLLALITAISFGGILAWGVWDVVRRWREVAKVQRMVCEISDEECEEFYSAAEQCDVELTVDDKGRTRSSPLDFG